MFAKHRGTSTFQPKRMSWSKRKRGKVPRTQIKKKITTKVFNINQITGGNTGPCQPPRNRVTIRAEATIMWVYSPIIKRAHFMELYSVWNPATSSFSHSIRSKGVRAHSAKAAVRKRRNPKGW